MGYLQGDKPISITKLLAMHAEREKLPCSPRMTQLCQRY